MKALRRKKRERQFFDVVLAEEKSLKQRLKHLFRHGETINLRPTFVHRYQFLVFLLVVLGGVTIWLRPSIFTRAEATAFYPQNCLGTWRDPQAAQGETETASSGVLFSKENSASFSGGQSRIFCGGFVPPNFATSGRLLSVGVTMVWQVGPITPGTLPQGSFEPIPVPTSTTTEASDSGTETTSTPDEDSSTVETTTEPVSFFQRLFWPQAFAQEEGSPPVVTPEPVATPQPEASPTPQPEIPPAPPVEPPSQTTEESPPPTTGPSSLPIEDKIEDPVILGPPLEASLEPLPPGGSSTTESSTSSTEEEIPSTTPLPEPFIPDENFLLLSYSLDGSNWIPLGRVGIENWQHLTFSLPVTSWSDLRNIQISIEGVSTTLPLPLPEVLLDGMFVEARYEKSLLGDFVDSMSSSSTSGEKPLFDLPTADSDYLNQTAEKLRTLMPGEIVLSQQFESSSSIAFKAPKAGGYEVFLYYKETGIIEQLTNTPAIETEPAIREGYVAWAYAYGNIGKERGEIYLYDIAAKETQKLTDDIFADQPPYFEGSFVVWEKLDAQGQSHIFEYDLETKEVRQRDKQKFEERPLPGEPDVPQ